MPSLGATLLFVPLGSIAAVAIAQPARAAESLVPIFSIAKSENKNQVQYVVRLDPQCAPVGPNPVSAYWRMLEKGPTQTAPILSRELRAYGLASQVLDATSGRVRVVLKALPDRTLVVTTQRASDGQCHALATVPIAGAPAYLFNVYVHIRWYGVDYVLLQGWSMDRSHVLREKLKM
jgi:hypothetical protein